MLAGSSGPRREAVGVEEETLVQSAHFSYTRCRKLAGSRKHPSEPLLERDRSPSTTHLSSSGVGVRSDKRYVLLLPGAQIAERLPHTCVHASKLQHPRNKCHEGQSRQCGHDAARARKDDTASLSSKGRSQLLFPPLTTPNPAPTASTPRSITLLHRAVFGRAQMKLNAAVQDTERDAAGARDDVTPASRLSGSRSAGKRTLLHRLPRARGSGGRGAGS